MATTTVDSQLLRLSGGMPVGLSILCNRSTMNVDVSNIYEKAIQNQANELMTSIGGCHEQTGGKLYKTVSGKCGNVRGELAECACYPLNRLVPMGRIRRIDYENKVISRIIANINPASFNLNLAVFASGYLLGEQILLFKIFNTFRAAAGQLHIFFIDSLYNEAVTSNSPTPCMKQFIEEVSQCLPPDLSLRVTFFSDADGYIQLATKYPEYRHDLIIGADIVDTIGPDPKKDGLFETVEKIRSNAYRTNEPAILLAKFGLDGASGTCGTDTSGALSGCEDPIVARVRRTLQDNKLAIISGGAGGAGGAVVSKSRGAVGSQIGTGAIVGIVIGVVVVLASVVALSVIFGGKKKKSTAEK